MIHEIRRHTFVAVSFLVDDLSRSLPMPRADIPLPPL